MLRDVDFARARHVVQLGVGTGCITRALLKELRPDARLLSVELNPVFVEECREEIVDRRLVLRQGCASELPVLLAELGMPEIDYVISSLPFAIMDAAMVDRIIAVSADHLAPDGMFVQYQYSLRQRAALERRFREVYVGFALANIPPAYVYECTL
ncbi:MAG: methyltransferase domain-containing protein [Gemmatimonadales bacterium]|nr:methyltransferase domain-containing protein [Gemmatimonadales bacterium]